MNSELSIKITHDKFRFHVATVETENNNIVIGGNNYRLVLVLYYSDQVDVEKVNSSITNLALEVCENLHHRTIIPSENPLLSVSKTEAQVNVDKIGGHDHLSFPLSCTAIIKLENTHIEDLCSYIGKALIEKIKEKASLEQSINRIKVNVIQNIGPKEARMKFSIN